MGGLSFPSLFFGIFRAKFSKIFGKFEKIGLKRAEVFRE